MPFFENQIKHEENATRQFFPMDMIIEIELVQILSAII